MKLATFLMAVIALLTVACSRKESADQPREQKPSLQPCVNLNTATADELAGLPGIGPAFAKQIIEHRERNGPFRRPQEVIIIRGFSERKYRAIAGLVCVE